MASKESRRPPLHPLETPSWNLKLCGEEDNAAGAPPHFVSACHAVGRDTRCYDELSWLGEMSWLVVDETKVFGGWSIGPETGHGGSHGFGTPVDVDLATITARVAEAAQDWFTGCEHILWPVASRNPLRLPKPEVRNVRAVWVSPGEARSCAVSETSANNLDGRIRCVAMYSGDGSAFDGRTCDDR